jgi:SAM-dependent methyltransferase
MTRDVLFPGLANWDPAAFLAFLEGEGFTQDGLAAMPSPLSRPVDGRHAAAARAMLAAQPCGAIGALIRMFSLGEALDATEALRLFGWQLKELESLGLLVRDGPLVRSIVRLMPYAGQYHAGDFAERQLAPSGDYVMGLSPSTRALGSLVPPGRFGRALEVACGMAWLARLLAGRGCEVTATDLNGRALEIARFNGRLQGIESVRLLQGDLLEPVRDDPAYDLIVCNPPYVLSPGGSLVFRETPDAAPGEVCRRLAASIPERLAAGGIAIIMINWGHEHDDDWADAPLSWLASSDLQAWLFQNDANTPGEYAWSWIRHDPRFESPGEVGAEMERWLAYLRGHSIRRVSNGFLILRRPLLGEPAWRRADRRNISELSSHAGTDVANVLHNETWLRMRATTNPHDALLDLAFSVPDGIEAFAETELVDGWVRRTIRLRSPGRLSYDGQVDENLLRLLEVIRAGQRPRAMLEEILRHPEIGRQPDLAVSIEALVHELLRHGLIIPR